MPTFDTPQPISVTVEIEVGAINIDAQERTDTIVEITPTDPSHPGDVAAAEETQVRYADGRLSIVGPKRRRHFSTAGSASVTVSVALPNDSQLRTQAGVAPLNCSGQLGRCRIETGVGDVHLAIAGPLEIKAGKGDVAVQRVREEAELAMGAGDAHLDAVDGSATVKLASGDLSIGTITGELRANTANGDIAVRQALGNVTTKTANGDVSLSEVVHGKIVVQSGRGDLNVAVRDGVPAWLDLKTALGSVKNRLEPSERPQDGEESVEIHASSALGDITVRRSEANVTQTH